MKRFALTLIAGLAVLLPAPRAGGQPTQTIERSCTGRYFLRILGEGGGNTLFTFHPTIADITPPLRFDGRAGCGTTVPNRCRRRASEALLACMEAQAAHLNSNDNFDACRWDIGESRRVTGYFDHRLRTRPFGAYLHPYVCAAVNQWYDAHTPQRSHTATVRYELHGVVSGDHGCGGDDRHSTTRKLATFTMVCAREHAAHADITWPNQRFVRHYMGGAYDAPHFLALALDGADPARCREACLARERCVAWTLDRPGPQLHVPRCRLFDDLYARAPFPASDSGAK